METLKCKKKLYKKIKKYFENNITSEEGGVLFGETNEILRFQPLKNIAENKITLYTVEPLEWLACIKNSKEKIIGTIHSHLVKLPFPSATDITNLYIGYTLIYCKTIDQIKAFKIQKNVGYEIVNLEVI
jgi:proteasome lid subunit RPN8/RPN11